MLARIMMPRGGPLARAHRLIQTYNRPRVPGHFQIPYAGKPTTQPGSAYVDGAFPIISAPGDFLPGKGRTNRGVQAHRWNLDGPFHGVTAASGRAGPVSCRRERKVTLRKMRGFALRIDVGPGRI